MIFQNIMNFLTQPLGYKPCPDGYDPGTEGSAFEKYCYASLDNPDLKDVRNSKTITVDSPSAPVEKRFWLRQTSSVIPYQVASSATCPPNTVPFNGSCFQTCPPGTEQIEIQTPGATSGSTTTECRAACNDSGWHELTWAYKDNTGIKYFGSADNGSLRLHNNKFMRTDNWRQKMKDVRPDWCYHRITTSDVGTEGYVESNNWPIGVMTTTVTQDNMTLGQFDNKITPGYVGIYGERTATKLGVPTIAGPCPPPNVATSAGQCARPPPANMTIVGNQYITTQPCPARFSDQNKISAARCDPKSVYRRKYLSLIQYVMGLVVIILIVVVLLRLRK